MLAYDGRLQVSRVDNVFYMQETINLLISNMNKAFVNPWLKVINKLTDFCVISLFILKQKQIKEKKTIAV